jgi:hypothetical protein
MGMGLVVLSALCLPASIAMAETPDASSQSGIGRGKGQAATDSYGNRNLGGPYGFYSYPRHRSVDRGTSALDRPLSGLSVGISPYYDGYHGSAYYGRDYGAPYFGGGYYDEGVYYRERRDH